MYALCLADCCKRTGDISLAGSGGCCAPGGVKMLWRHMQKPGGSWNRKLLSCLLSLCLLARCSMLRAVDFVMCGLLCCVTLQHCPGNAVMHKTDFKACMLSLWPVAT